MLKAQAPAAARAQKGFTTWAALFPKAKQTGRSQQIGWSQPGGARWRFSLMILLSFNMMASVECQTPSCEACLFFVANMGART